MRKVFYSPNWPATTLDQVSARAYGATEIIQSDTLAGYAEIPEAHDTVDGRLAQLAERRFGASQSVSYTYGQKTYDVPCDQQAGTNVLGAIVGLQLANSTGPITWKLGADFLPLSLADLVSLGQLMRTHVQACYDNEATLAAQIAASSDPASVDIEQGWPT